MGITPVDNASAEGHLMRVTGQAGERQSMLETQMSRHASARARQRGIRETHVLAVLKYGDRITRRGSDTEAVWLSKAALASLGHQTPEGVGVDRLRNLYVLVSADETIITVVRTQGSTYRRNTASPKF